MRLSNFRYEEIKKTVVWFFNKYIVNCTPISGFEIACKIGAITIPYSAFDIETKNLMEKQSEEGFSINNNGKWYIYYNDTKPYDRVNFTIMHEIAHIILGHMEESKVADMEANFFTKFALAPPVLIYKYGIDNPYDVSTRFGLSYEAACYAYSYYQKWLNYGGHFYTNYEVEICKIFGIAV